MNGYKDKSVTLLQLLTNACGAEFEDEDLAVDIIEETIKDAANSSINKRKMFDDFYKWHDSLTTAESDEHSMTSAIEYYFFKQ